MVVERYSEWVRRSFRWIRDPARDGGLPHHIQRLGLVDAEIRGLRHGELIDAEGRDRADEHGVLLKERSTIRAHLWVFGVYEFIRMLDARLRREPSLAMNASIAAIATTKRAFSRWWVPLAKLKPEGRHAREDDAVAWPGLGWRLNDALVIDQKDLSEAFREMRVAPRSRPEGDA